MKICITGASRGLGQELCRKAAGLGHKIWGIARNAESLRKLESELEPDKFFWTETDVGSADSVFKWKQSMKMRGFSPDLVLLNASVLQDDLEQSGYNHFHGEKNLNINLSGALRCVDALMPDMLGKGGGTFMAVASTVMLRPSVRSAAYSASKAGIALAMRSLDLAYKAEGVRFKTVCLGPIATEMWEGRRNWMVPSSAEAALAILKFARSGRSTLYFPFVSTSLLRLSMWLPDSVFAKASAKLMK